MPRRNDLDSILLIGAGPIVIGQACEFDYSGVQACKALREEGYRVILVNSNPATIMTDPETADSTYIEPINWKTLEKIIEKEKPSALLPTMGGQTALNTALDLKIFSPSEPLGILILFSGLIFTGMIFYIIFAVSTNKESLEDKKIRTKKEDLQQEKIGKLFPKKK